MELVETSGVSSEAELLNRPAEKPFGHFLHAVASKKCQVDAILGGHHELWSDSCKELRSFSGRTLLDNCLVNIGSYQAPSRCASDSLPFVLAGVKSAHLHRLVLGQG